MLVQCPQCKGRRMIEVGERGDDTALDWATTTASLSYTKVVKTCDVCNGEGRATATERLPVLQDGRRIGSVPPSFDPTRIRSLSWMYSPRASDFMRGEDAWIAASSLGPGDLEAVAGFLWERHDDQPQEKK